MKPAWPRAPWCRLGRLFCSALGHAPCDPATPVPGQCPKDQRDAWRDVHLNFACTGGGSGGRPASIWGDGGVQSGQCVPEPQVAVRNSTQVGTGPPERTSRPELKGRHETGARPPASSAPVSETQPCSPSYKFMCMFEGARGRCCPCTRGRTGWNWGGGTTWTERGDLKALVLQRNTPENTVNLTCLLPRATARI